MLNVVIDLGEEDLVSGIKSLQSLPDKTSFTKTKGDEEETPLLLTSVKKKKKEKKKKKKKEAIELMGDSYEDDSPLTSFNSEYNLLDIDAIIDEIEGDDDISDSIIDDQKRGYGKLKKEANPFKKEFAEELTMLYDLLDETNKFGKKLDKIFESTQNSKARGMSKYTADTVTAILSSKQNKLQILKEIASVKKTIQDLKIKHDGKNKDNADNSSDAAAAAYLSNIVKYGRSNFLKAVDDDKAIDAIIKKDTGSDDEDFYFDEEHEEFDSIIHERLMNEGNPFRTELGNTYIELENRKVSIVIKKCIDTGDWEFIALDKDNQQVWDYPLPSKDNIGKLKFSGDNRYATDKLGRSYKVIEYYSDDL